MNFAPYKSVVITAISNSYYTCTYDLFFDPITNTVSGTITIKVINPYSNWVQIGRINVLPTSRQAHGTYTSDYPELQITIDGKVSCAGGTAGQLYTWNVSYDVSAS